MGPFIHIRSSKFPILPGEVEELVNDGIFGKALAIYLEEKLRERGYRNPSHCCEDWGWWVHLEDAPFWFGVCIYCFSDLEVKEFACTDGASSHRQWSWSRFRFIDTRPWVAKLQDDLVAIFRNDPDVELLGITDVFPLNGRTS